MFTHWDIRTCRPVHACCLAPYGRPHGRQRVARAGATRLPLPCEVEVSIASPHKAWGGSRSQARCKPGTDASIFLAFQDQLHAGRRVPMLSKTGSNRSIRQRSGGVMEILGPKTTISGSTSALHSGSTRICSPSYLASSSRPWARRSLWWNVHSECCGSSGVYGWAQRFVKELRLLKLLIRRPR